MDDIVELTRIKETEVGSERTTHRTYQGQNRWQTEIWIKSRELGSGSYGAVWLEEEAQSHRLRAVKRVRKRSSAWDEKKEIAAMAKVRQFPQYFAYLHGWYESQDWIFLAMDYFEMGDLSHHLQFKIPENQARDITQQLLRGLTELHGMGITHRDLKPTNVFVVMRSASSWDVRIGDFGIAKRVNADETALRTITGTRQYMAPELDPWLVDDEESHSYTQAVDVWALGILLFQMLTLQAAFRDPSSLRKYFKGKTTFPEEPLLQESITLPCIEFLKAVLQPLPKDRPTSKDTFCYEWMKTASSDPGITAVQTLLSEVRVAQDAGAVGSSTDARQNKPEELDTRPYQDQDAGRPPAQATPSNKDRVWQQLWEESPLESPSQEFEPFAHGIAAGDSLPSLPNRRSPLLEAVSRSNGGAAEILPLDWQTCDTPEGRNSVKHTTGWSPLIDPRISPTDSRAIMPPQSPSASFYDVSDDQESECSSIKRTQSKKSVKLLFAKSKVYVHPSASAKENVSGYIAMVEQKPVSGEDRRRSTVTHSQSAAGKSKEAERSGNNHNILLSWLPEASLGEEREKYAKADMTEVESFHHRPDLVPPPPAITTHSGAIGATPFSVPLSEVVSILFRPPSSGWWHGSIVVNTRAGELPTLFFHDNECRSTIDQRTRLQQKTFVTGSTTRGGVYWGGDEVMKWLKSLATVARSAHEPNLYLIGPTEDDTGSREYRWGSLPSIPNLRITVIAADGLYKRDLFSLPDPFAVATVSGEQKRTTSVMKKTLNPRWNEFFDLRVTEDSIIAIQVHDQRRFKKKDMGLLGIVNLRVGSIIDLDKGGQEMVTRYLRKSMDSLIVQGKLILDLDTNLKRPIP